MIFCWSKAKLANRLHRNFTSKEKIQIKAWYRKFRHRNIELQRVWLENLRGKWIVQGKKKNSGDNLACITMLDQMKDELLLLLSLYFTSVKYYKNKI